MKLLTFILLSSMILFGACTGKENEQFTDRCEKFIGAKMLTIKERKEACVYNDIYQLNGKIYTICYCCNCNKIFMAIDCEEKFLCDWAEECMTDFFINAEYLFTVEGW